MQSQGARRVKVWGELSLCIPDSCLLTVSSHGLSQHVGVSSGLSSYKSTISVGLEVGSRPHLTFITTSQALSPNRVTLGVMASKY